MKKLLLLMLIPAMLMTASCNKQKEENARLKAKNDSLLALGYQKDTTVMEFVRAFNEIQSNLDSIKMKENIIGQNTKGGTEVQASAREQITGDINSIYQMLEKNRATVASLQKKLKASNTKNTQLETMIDNLNKSIVEKDAEIAELKDQLGKLNIKVTDLGNQVSTLNTNVDNLSAENKAKQQAIDEKTAALNTGYYVVGTTKELKEKKVIDKTGGFIGLGRTKTLTDFDKSNFTKIDITTLTEIPINKKKATLLSNHPAGSYKLEGTPKKSVDKLVILNYADFWSRSKFLVIAAD